MKTALASLALGVLLVSFGCGDDDSPTAASPTSYNGFWQGNTSQNKVINFDVDKGAVTRVVVGYAVSGAGCTGNHTTTFPLATPQPVSGASFTVTTSIVTITGHFSSANDATGSLSFTVASGCPGSGSATWSATRS